VLEPALLDEAAPAITQWSSNAFCGEGCFSVVLLCCYCCCGSLCQPL